MSLRATFRGFTRTAQLFVVALTVFAFGIAAPTTLMNLYLDAAGFDRAFIGLWQSISQFGALLLAPAAMLLFDRIGRANALWLGAAASIIVRSFTVLSPRPEIILAAEALSGFGTVLFGLASISLLADVSAESERAALFSVSDASRTLALLLGSLVFGVLPGLIAPHLIGPDADSESYRLALVISYAIRLCGVIPLLMIARGREPLPPAHTEQNVVRFLDARLLMRQRPQVYTYAIPIGLAWLADSLVFPFFNLFLKDSFGMSDAGIGLVLGLRSLVGGFALLLAPMAAARFGYRRGVTGGLLALSVVFVLIGSGQNAWWVVALSLGQVALFAVAMMLYRVFVINASARAEFLLVSTVMAITANVGPAIGPLISGVVQERFGFGPLFVLGAVLMLLAAALFAAATREARPAAAGG